MNFLKYILKKKSICVILLLSTINFNAQTKYLQVTYKKQSILSKTIDKTVANDLVKLREIKKFEAQQNEALSDVSFQLICNKLGESLFKPNEFLEIEGDRWKKLFVKLGGGGDIIYTNIYKKEQLWEKEAFGSFFLVTNDIDKFNWVLVNETKKIGNYLCYKALGEMEIESQNKIKKIEIIAWYAPDLNYPFGPVEYCNLPGLILDVEVSGNRFYASKIEFKSDEKQLIIKPSKGKRVSLKELKDIGRSIISKSKM